ncbi:nucleoside 2-deoxyribosyltransferase domain-containing protein [Aquimarina aquimarini]|uniref:nucleoside 2-deoxyribosyltransferase domain-containing protein n=1 Tax=Aquimarina aquimarini TaxID=1191734 RepID=UPI000D55AED6|nr:nucleoside 2-deoxyribosyltransferase domain-containing protein [Aquimarina aquimarini]
MNVIEAPEEVNINNQFSVFLAGSIEGDKATKWQDIIIQNLTKEEIVILNPRRLSWDSSWKQEISNPIFKEQVTWELQALEQADMIIMYFDKTTKSPITLLELGLFAKSKKLTVCCPKGFWRKGNVDIVCEHYNIKQVDTIEELIEKVKKELK